MWKHPRVGALLAGLALAGCGGGSTVTTHATGQAPASSSGKSITPAAGAVITGGGLTVSEALASTRTGPLAVHGKLVRDGAIWRLCMTTSAEGECGSPSLSVAGLTEPPVASPDADVSLLGTVIDGTLTVTPTVQ